MMAPLPMLAFWLIVALGLSAAWSALRMGLPGVGRDYSGWRWAGLASLALPLTAIFMGFGDSHGAMEAMKPQNGLRCTIDGLIAGLGVGAALFAWLKGGAPTSPARAGWVIGIAAGSAGATAVGLHCSSNDMIHIARWHGRAVPLWGVAGRLLLAPLLRKTGGIPGDWAGRGAKLVQDGVLPALERQRAEIESQRALATGDAGLLKRPHGPEWYAWGLRASTTTRRTPAELHAMGVEQLAELHARMDVILKGFGLTQGPVGQRAMELQRRPELNFPADDAGRAQIVAYMQKRLDAIRVQLPRAFRNLT
ncbi:MAG: DUF1109 family protein, partial [Sphingopyxis sp.]|nr:DUF1109 family protein [Sphingopyxis sp.]